MKRSLIVAACVFAASTATAQTSYTNKSAFLTAAGTTQTETFSSAPVGAFTTTAGTFNANFDGFSVTGRNNGNYVGIATGAVSSSGPNTPIPGVFVGQNFLSFANQTGGIVSMTINLNQATTAFGFDWFNTDLTDSYAVNIPGGTVFNSPPFTLAGSSATQGFFGLVSSTPFTSVVITNNRTGGYLSDMGLDNFVTNGFGSVVGSVPEPSTWAMMLIGFGAIGASMRRKRRVSAIAQMA